MRIGVLTSIATAIAISAVVITGGGGGGPVGGSTTWTTANVWVNTSAGASPSRCLGAGAGTGCAYDSTHAYNNLQTAFTAAQAGDRIVVKCGTYGSFSLTSGTEATAVNIYAESYDQAVTAYDVLDSTTCVYTSSLAVDGVDRVHIYGIQATPGPWVGTRADGATLANQSGGGLNICTFNCDPLTLTDILIDGFHGKDGFTRVNHVVIDHSAFGGYDVCFTSGQVHATAAQAAAQEDAFRFWDGTGGSSTPQNSTIRNSVMHDLIMANNNSEEGNQCTFGSTVGPHSDCMQNNGGINITVEANIFVNCSSSDIQWNPFSGATIGAQTIQNNVFGPLTGAFVNGTVLGTQTAGGDCSQIIVRNNLYWASQGINPGGSPGGCTGGAMQVYGNVFRGSGCIGNGNTTSYVHNVWLGATCGTTPKSCTPTFASGTPSTSENWNNTTPDFNVSTSDTCTLSYAHTTFPTTDILGLTRPLGAGADAGANEIP